VNFGFSDSQMNSDFVKMKTQVDGKIANLNQLIDRNIAKMTS
jgi:hypothetical protein